MSPPNRVPAGRSGRMWLHRRLDTAGRGRDQLDRKLRILIPEQQRLRLRADHYRRDWLALARLAQTWLLRAVLISGQDGIRHATPTELADVQVVWTAAMGLSYPADARLVSHGAPSPAAPDNAAIGPATAAFEAALLAGVRSAAADEAVRRIDAEIAVTRRRLRALDKRLLPSLRASLATLELALEQAEQDDGIRLRRAAAAPPDRRPPS